MSMGLLPKKEKKQNAKSYVHTYFLIILLTFFYAGTSFVLQKVCKCIQSIILYIVDQGSSLKKRGARGAPAP